MRLPIFIFFTLSTVMLAAGPSRSLTLGTGLQAALPTATFTEDATLTEGGYATLRGKAGNPAIALDDLPEESLTFAAVIRVQAARSSGARAVAEFEGVLGDRALFRIVNGRLEIGIKVKESWQRLASPTKLPVNRWVLVAGMLDGGKLYCVVDGFVDRVAPLTNQPRGPFTQVRLGESGSDQAFVGDLRRVEIIPGRADLDGLARKLGVPPPAETLPVKTVSASVPKFPPDKALRVSGETIHPIVDSGGANVTMVPWSGPRGKELISTGAYALHAPRAALLRPVGTDPLFAQRALSYPLYDTGHTLPFKGLRLDAVVRPDGRFDLIAHGGNTLFGDGYLTYYRNTGEVGAPKFAHATRKGVAGKSLLTALADSVHSLAVSDLSGDQVPDLILVTREPLAAYFPDNVTFWRDTKHPNAGRGRGYDVAGNWLGKRLRARVYWAEGYWTPEQELEFKAVKPVLMGDDDFQAQWQTCGFNVHAFALPLQGRPHLLLAADVDQVIALPTRFEGGEIRCEPGRPLLEGGASVVATYFNSTFSTADLDDDGVPEIIMSGNTGRPTVLKGDAPGNFREVGTLNRRGGYIEMDTLAVPVRLDWDRDGRSDIIAGDASGWLWFWPGTADPAVYGVPALFTREGKPVRHVAGPNGSIQGPSESGWGYLNPTAGDWSGRGELSIITNDIKGELMLYSPTAPGSLALEAPRRFRWQGKDLLTAWRARPAIVPAVFSANKLPRLLFMDWEGDLALGTPTAAGGTEFAHIAKLAGPDGKLLKLGTPWGGQWGRAKFAITDWDGDGRWDVLFGTMRSVHASFLSGDNIPAAATPFLLRNLGTNEAPVFAQPVSIRKADGGLIDAGHHICAVWPTDLDGDGREDLIYGSEDGKVYYFFRKELR